MYREIKSYFLWNWLTNYVGERDWPIMLVKGIDLASNSVQILDTNDKKYD